MKSFTKNYGLLSDEKSDNESEKEASGEESTQSSAG